MQEELAVSGGERTFRNTPFVRVEILTLVAIVGVGKVERTPNPALRCREGHGSVIEQCHRPRIVLHSRRGERRFADLLAFRPAFDTAGDGLCGLVGGENRVLTTEVGIFAHRVVGEGLDVTLGIATSPREFCGDLASPFPLGDGVFEQIALLAVNREAGDCRPTHVVVYHTFNVTSWLFTDSGNAELYERAPLLPTARVRSRLRNGTPRCRLVEFSTVGISLYLGT